ncbi:response regulator [Bacillaceae bacterium W0354]
MEKLLVYVVEDEMGIRLLLTEVIKQLGFDVDSFEGIEQALTAVKIKSPDLIFVDYMIGNVGGDQLVRQLQAEGTYIPTVVMSGRAKSEVAEYFSDLKVDYFLEKPFTVDQVQEILNNIPQNVIRA